MPRRVSVTELKTHCLRIVEEVAAKHHDVVITKRGRQVARLVPIGVERRDAAVERLRGTLLQGDELGDFDTGVAWRSARR